MSENAVLNSFKIDIISSTRWELKMWRDGFPPKGAKLDETLPMNPERDEVQGLRTPMKDYVTQNPYFPSSHVCIR